MATELSENMSKLIHRLFMAYLKDNELCIIGGWRRLEQRLMYRELMQRERQKREEEFAQLDFLSALRIAA